MISLKLNFLPSCVSLAFVSVCFHVSLYCALTGCLSIPPSALAPGMGVAVYAGLVGALLLCVILVLCVGVLAYRRRCRHLHGDITDSSSALTAAFHPGNYKPPRQGKFTHTHTYSQSHTCIIQYTFLIQCLFLLLFIFKTFLVFTHLNRRISQVISLSHCYSSHKFILFIPLAPLT